MSGLGLALLGLVALLLVTTGLPAFVVLVLAAGVGALAGVASGTIPVALLGALPARFVNLLESDLLQALPLFVLMGALLNRMMVVPALFRSLVWLLPRRAGAQPAAGLAIGALLGPMSGSVGASVLALSRSVAPSLAASGMAPAHTQAIVALGSTLGVVVPPSLVLILLGDAMLTAHTIALNATGRADRIINTQDVMRSALVPAAMVVLVCLVIAWLGARGAHGRDAAAAAPAVEKPEPAEMATAAIALLLLVVLLGGVATGFFYAVEAAAAGAVILFVTGVVTGRLTAASLEKLLSEVLQTTGALFAPLLAATTFTLVLRLLGTDKLIEQWIAALPGGEVTSVVTILGVMGLTALVLDAFEIIFVVVPILVPPLLMRASDAQWVSALILLTLQVSFLVPPAGYAVMMTQGVLGRHVSAVGVARALVPFVLAEVLIVGLVLWQPRLVHLLEPPPDPSVKAGAKPLSKDDVERRFRELMPPPPALPGGLPPFPSNPGR